MNHTIISRLSEIAGLAQEFIEDASRRHQYARSADLAIIRDRIEALQIELEAEDRQYADWIADTDARLFGTRPVNSEQKEKAA